MNKDELKMITKYMEYIEWRDCVSCGGWQNPSDMVGWGDNQIIQTVGFLASESEQTVVLVQATGDAGQGAIGCNWMAIPKSLITKRLQLTIKRKS